jgi:hypothetical protein
MKHHLAVGQRSDGFSIFTDVGDEHHRVVAGLHRCGAQRTGPHVIADRPKRLCEADLVVVREFLSAEHQDQMVQPGAVDGIGVLCGNRFAKVYTGYLGAKRCR